MSKVILAYDHQQNGRIVGCENTGYAAVGLLKSDRPVT
jgi:hypothetical protein